MEQSIIHVVHKSLETINYVLQSEECDKPFYICDINDIVNKYEKWVHYLPRIKPFYAVKCNDHPVVLKVLAALGVGFDCASRAELKKILSIEGVGPNQIIYAHTIKPPTHITYAASVDVNLTTFDNKCELFKLKKLFPDCKAVIRIKYDASESTRSLGEKFGCDPVREAPQLLKLAQKLGINVVGVSFHVGSGCRTTLAYYGAIAAARGVFDVANKLGMHFSLLDIGGGYPGSANDALAEYATYINTALDEYFPDQSIRVISEPGTYFVSSAFTLLCSIHSVKKKEENLPAPQYMYYVNDGIYGSFANVLSFNLTKIPNTLKDHSGEEKFVSTIWGPTCDSLDKIVSNIMLPKLELGEWLVFQECGAYTLTWSTPFNGFDVADVYCCVNHHNGSWLSKQKSFLNDTFNIHSF